jgi:hypothetical protein
MGAMMGYDGWAGSGMVWTMGLVWLLVVVDLALVGAAAIKYLFFDRARWPGASGGPRDLPRAMQRDG